MEMTPIARLRCDLTGKFGVPRQSGLAESLTGTVVFEPPYRSREALRGMEGFNYLWLLWVFSENTAAPWSPTVRPPRLGGNRRLGVFATRSPFRPNPIGLSAVRLLGLRDTPDRGTVLDVAGADLLDGTPILDVKPYVPYADCRPDALGGFAAEKPETLERVVLPPALAEAAGLPPEKLAALRDVLAQDPRPRYHHDPARVYGLDFAGHNVRFTVDGGVLTVIAVE